LASVGHPDRHPGNFVGIKINAIITKSLIQKMIYKKL